MTTFLPSREELLANPPPMLSGAATGEVATFGELIGAAATSESLETNYWDQEGRVRGDIIRELTTTLGPGVYEAALPTSYDLNNHGRMSLQGGPEELLRYITDANVIGNGKHYEQFLTNLFELRDDADPKWQGITVNSLADINAEVIRQRREEYQDAQDTLNMGGAGSGVVEFLGRGAVAMTDEINIALAPLGIGGSLARVVLGEAVLGGIGEAAILPSMYDQAEKLDIPDPDPITQIAMGVVFGAALPVGFRGVSASSRMAVDGVKRYLDLRAGRNTSTDLPEGTNAAEAEALARETEAALLRDAPLPEAPDTTQAQSWRNAIAAVESRGSGNYAARGPVMPSGSYAGDRAYGRYQIMGRNIPAWSKQYLDREMSIDEFMASPDVQDELFDAVFGAAVRKYGNPQDAASVWFTGRPLSEGGSRSDGFITGNEYVNRFTNALDNPQSGTPRPPSGAGATAPTGTRAGYTAPDQVVTPSGTRIDVEYEVVDVSLLTRASGDLQPRDRTRAASDEWISTTAAKLDPSQLMPSPLATTGTPIISPDNLIESGNGRVAAISRAYEIHPDRGDAYRSAIAEAGFDIPEGIKDPVLIARRQSDLSQSARVDFVNDANTSNIARMSATEQATQNARALNSHTMAQYSPGSAISAPENTPFARAFLANLPANERAALTTAEGRLSLDGERRLRQALFARAYGAPDLIAKHAEASDPAMRSLIDALAEAAPAWSALRADIEAGLIKPELDLTDHLLDAVRLIGDARKTASKAGSSTAGAIDDALAQISLDGAIHPLTEGVVQIFRKGDRVRPDREITELLTGYTHEARIVGKTDAALFDNELSSGPMEMLDAIQKETDLFAPGGPGTRPRDENLYRQPNRPAAQSRSGQASEPLDTSQIPEQSYIDGAQSEGSISATAQGVADLRAATKFDFETIQQMPDVTKALDDMNAIPRTDLAPNYGTPEYWANREFLLNGKKALGKDDAIDYLYGVARRLAWAEDGLTPPKKLNADRKATILIGAPASGKSTVANPIARDLGAAIVDVDEAKKIIPEFGGGVGVNAVHGESSQITKDLLSEFTEEGSNVVLPKVGDRSASIENLVARLKASGYTVDLIMVDVAPKQAWERMVGRYRQTGRIIEPNYMRDAIDAPRQTYQTLKENGNADNYAKIDNSPALDQPRGIIEDPSGIIPAKLADSGPDRRNRAGPLQRGELGEGAQGNARTQSSPRQESQVAAARDTFTDDFEIIGLDGQTYRASEILDDLEADANVADIINLCNPKGGA